MNSKAAVAQFQSAHPFPPAELKKHDPRSHTKPHEEGPSFVTVCYPVSAAYNVDMSNDAARSSTEIYSPLETSTHQDHVIAHVLGTTVLGWVVAGEAAHFLLDIGFLWTIYLDGEMNLLPQGVAIAELDSDEATGADKTEMAFDTELLLSEGYDARGLKRFTPARTECLVTGVEVFGSNTGRRLIIRGETANIEIETSLTDGVIMVSSN